MWVCEVLNYRKHNGDRAEGDRILILEDTDGDAKADKSTVFHQGRDVDSAHGICVLGNKALISCGDDVFWLIDDNGDDKADRKELLFTKIGGAQHDHGIHAFHFGPDGRLYFNFGNAGKQLCDKNGNLITDIHGVKCTNQNNRPYQQGMVFRCELDGSNFEVLAWNFRNNWEVAVDSFGTMWQSDNDDDGNRGVRINYVMEFGNYGYSDEMTGAGWQTPRIGWESDIPQRHWHQNDPGVVPNMLMTGAGSPTGMQVYEGDLLPSIFHGQPLHCDAGPNVVRAYITQPDGAGYKAEIVNILEGSKNRWFRPSDVAVAPDGSLIAADWYDPGVGGHGMGDITRGRLFRVTTKAAEKFQVPSFKLDTVEGAVAALKSPNEEQRYLAWQSLKKLDGREALTKLFEDAKALPQHRARALWALQSSPGLQPETASKGQNGNESAKSPSVGLKPETTLAAALTDNDPNIRITALRAARQLWQQKQPEKLREVIAKIAFGDSPAFRREVAIAMRFDPKSANRWNVWSSTGGVDRIWRFRDGKTAVELANLLTHPEGQKLLSEYSNKKPLDLLRSLQLLSYKHPAEVSAAALTIFLKADAETALAATALLDRNAITSNPEAKTLIAALGRVSDRAAVAVMNQHFWPDKREDVRRVLIDALALSGEGGRAILKWQSEGKLPPQFKDQAALALSRSTDAGLRDQAARGERSGQFPQTARTPEAEGRCRQRSGHVHAGWLRGLPPRQRPVHRLRPRSHANRCEAQPRRPLHRHPLPQRRHRAQLRRPKRDDEGRSSCHGLCRE